MSLCDCEARAADHGGASISSNNTWGAEEPPRDVRGALTSSERAAEKSQSLTQAQGHRIRGHRAQGLCTAKCRAMGT